MPRGHTRKNIILAQSGLKQGPSLLKPEEKPPPLSLNEKGALAPLLREYSSKKDRLMKEIRETGAKKSKKEIKKHNIRIRNIRNRKGGGTGTERVKSGRRGCRHDSSREEGLIGSRM